MDSTLDSEIRLAMDRLSKEFFSALHGESSKMLGFVDLWEKFNDTIQTYRERLTNDTLSRVYSLASTVNTVTSSMLDFHASADALSEEMVSDVGRILDEGMGSLSFQEEDIQSNGRPLERSSSSAPYLEEASKWLLGNLHDPYPSITFKNSLARQSGASRKDIDSWFVDARRRIGWNTLRKKRFNNRRADIVDAAKRFQSQHTHYDHGLSKSIEHEFIGIEGAALKLFGDKVQESKLAAELDSAVRDMTPELQQRIHLDQQGRRLSKSQQGESKRFKMPYPTPERSPNSLTLTHLPSPSPSMSEASLEPLPPRKRQRTPEESDTDQVETPSRKRSRNEIDHPYRVDLGLLSPTSSVGDFQSPSDDVNLSSFSCPRPSKRKRCLSDSNANLPSKRLQIPQPRTHAVSNPLPLHAKQVPDETGDWMLQLFSLPSAFPNVFPSLSTEIPDPNIPLEVEWFNFAGCANMGNEGASSSPQATLMVEPSVRTITELFPSADADTASNWMQPSTSMPPYNLNLVEPFDMAQFNEVYNHNLSIRSVDVAHTSKVPIELPDFWTSSTNEGVLENLDDLALPALTSLPSLSTPKSPIPQMTIAATGKPLSVLEKELKAKQLLELEAQWLVLRAELAAAP